MTGYARERTREHDRQTYGYGHNNFNILPPRAAYCLRTGAASMPHGCLFASASETFFLRRMSSRSGEERSGRDGVKMGFAPGAGFGRGRPCCGVGALMWAAGAWAGERGVWSARTALAAAGMGRGNCEGAAGLGRRPELLVNGWVARGSNELSAEWDMLSRGDWDVLEVCSG